MDGRVMASWTGLPVAKPVPDAATATATAAAATAAVSLVSGEVKRIG